MAQVAGISTQKNAQGDITHVTIDLSKHGEVFTPVLQQLGVIEKTPFQKEWDEAMSVEAFKEHQLKVVRSLWSK